MQLYNQMQIEVHEHHYDIFLTYIFRIPITSQLKNFVVPNENFCSMGVNPKKKV